MPGSDLRINHFFQLFTFRTKLLELEYQHLEFIIVNIVENYLENENKFMTATTG